MRKELTTTMFVIVIVLGWAFQREVQSGKELSSIILDKNIRIHQLNDNLSALKNQPQINLILRGYITGTAERNLLRDTAYLKLIKPESYDRNI